MWYISVNFCNLWKAFLIIKVDKYYQLYIPKLVQTDMQRTCQSFKKKNKQRVNVVTRE